MSTWSEVEYRWEKPVPAFTRSRGKARRLMVDADRLLSEADENLEGGEAARDALAVARRALNLALALNKREGE